MKAGDVIEFKDGSTFDGGLETVRVGSVVVDRVWIEDLQSWFDRDEIVTKCKVTGFEERPRNIPARRVPVTEDQLLKMAAAAYETKNAMTRAGVRKQEAVRQMAEAMRMVLL